MSAEQNPIMIPVFLAGILAYALAKEGCEVIGKVGTNLCNETKAFVEEGSKLGKNALKDLTLGSIENLVHGVEDGGTIFNAMVGGVEIAFQRCGKAIVGTIANNENEYISEEIAENISKSYQNIISEIEKISTATDKEMELHLKKVENIKRENSVTNAENELITSELIHLKEKESEILTEIKNAERNYNESKDLEINKSIKSLLNSLNQNIEITRKEIELKNELLNNAENKKIKQAEKIIQENERLKELMTRKEEGKLILDKNQKLIKEHIKDEVQRITTTDNPIENGNIDVFEDENGNINVRIEGN